jgi:6,7-dimethyl-8-ribityllumazine synthase
MPSMPPDIRDEPDGRGRRIAIAIARFNGDVTERLLAGARAALRRRGVADADVTVAWVPGAFELPLCCQWLAATGRPDAIVALGAVIRGETDHYEYVSKAATDGCLRVTLDTGIPVAFGVLTCDDTAQAMARSGGSEGNKGEDVALAALAMTALGRALRDGKPDSPKHAASKHGKQGPPH